MQTTKCIRGRELNLIVGRRYLAGRPMASVENQLFPVFIYDLSDGGRAVAEVLEGFDYDEANEFLNAFNDGATSWDGRVW
ncbi:MAG: hypothetical protein WD069_18600 [Planctomycetales bacterium]